MTRWLCGTVGPDPGRLRVLEQAEEDVARIRERAERVAGPLEQRLRRNHWSEAAAAIARRER